MAMLQEEELRTLDDLMCFLQLPTPWFALYNKDKGLDSRLGDGHQQDLIAVCGNWYDVPHKASMLASLVETHPHAEVFLAGGRQERLTPAEAVECGGEPIFLQRWLSSRYGIHPKRVAVYTASRVTNHNLQCILHYVKQLHEFNQLAANVVIVEESFLVRREAASLAWQLKTALQGSSEALAELSFLPVGAKSFRELTSLHRGRADVALALVLGEYDRLNRYASPGKATTATHGHVERTNAVLDAGALDTMPEGLAERLSSLIARHNQDGGLLTEGRRVLEKLPREEMLPIASPELPLLPNGTHGSRSDTS